MRTSASLPLVADAAIFARLRQKHGQSRRKFLRNFEFLRSKRKNSGLLHPNATALLRFIWSN
jgi:hypothetical protein